MTMDLLPVPKVVREGKGRLALPGRVYVVLEPGSEAINGLGVTRFAEEAARVTGREFGIVAGRAKDGEAGIRVRVDGGMNGRLAEGIRRQAYRLTISRAGIEVIGAGAAGVFYGLQTLLQILREEAWRETRNAKRETQNEGIGGRGQGKGIVLPCVEIEDWPDFARRGVYLDTARGKVPRVETLLGLIEDLARLKYNELQLYVENNFAFRRHPEMWADTDPLTGEELRRLDAACRERHMEFVPSLTSLGHFEKILARSKYRHLAEAEPEQLVAIGAPCWHKEGPWSLCVTDAGAKKLLAEMYEEFLPNFSSGEFNICCDEAYDLGRVRSKKAAERKGTGRLYVEWVKYCAKLARKHGKRIQMWGDIILKYPELIGELPADATLLEWGYEAEHPFEEECGVIEKRLEGKGKGERTKDKGKGRGYYVAPGTSSWLTFGGRSRNALVNIHRAAEAGLRHGARGILVTDWGDIGHQQMLGVSYLALAYGAGAGWDVAATPVPGDRGRKGKTQKAELKSMLGAISRQVFGDASGRWAGLAYELGLTYERLGRLRKNGSAEFFLFREKWEEEDWVKKVPARGLERARRAAERLRGEFGELESMREDGELLRKEFAFTCRVIEHTCRRTWVRKAWLAGRRGGEMRQRLAELERESRELGQEFNKLWRARNKRSRVEDVRKEFRRLALEYRRAGAV
jgi:hexosaminidase